MSNGIMLRLREETAEQHKRAEQRPLEQLMIRGAIDRGLYGQSLGQRYLMHSALEKALDGLRAEDPAVAQIVTNDQYQAPNAEADLRFFGVDVATLQTLPATARFATLVKKTTSRALLGSLYVFEGSKNGARYIARALMRPLSLSPAGGMRYLDPHGDQQRPLWDAFKQRMDAAEFSGVEMDEMVAAAKATFDCIGELDDELFAVYGQGPALVAV